MGFGERVLTGRVVRDADGVGLRGVRVTLVSRSGGRITNHSAHVTAGDGAFRLRLPRAGVRSSFRLTFSLRGTPLEPIAPATFDSGEVVPQGLEYRVTVPVSRKLVTDATPAQPSTPGSVRGVVTHTNGRPVAAATVKLWERTPGATTLLDTQTTGDDGEYVLTYTYSAAPDLFVVVYDGSDPVGLSRALFEAAEHEVAHVVVAALSVAGSSEYARVDDVLSGPLTGVDPSTLGVDDVVYLSEKYGLPADTVRSYLTATKVAPDLSVGAEALFGLLAMGAPSTARSLATLAPTTVTRMLQGAAAKGLVSTAVGAGAAGTADDLVEDLVGLVAGSVAADNLAALLTHTASLTATKRDDVVREILTNRRRGEELLDAIGALPGFTSGEVDAIRRAASLVAVCLGHVPLVRAFDTAYSSPEAYTAAALSVSDWRTLLDATVGGNAVGTPAWVDGATESARRDTFAALVFRSAEHRHPSHRVATGLRAADPGDVTDLSKFLRDNPEVDLRTTSLGTFFGTANLTAVGDVPALLDRVRKLQRLFRVAPTHDRLAVVQELEAAGYGSAGSIARRSRESFVNRHQAAIGEAAARAVHARARKIAARTQMHDLRNRYQPPIGIDEEQPPDSIWQGEGVPPTDPPYIEMFGLPTCGCTSCQSVTSPSAYLVDVLNWLDAQDEDAETDPRTLYEVLVERRPDLAQVKLTCANSETALPQVDLAIEVFETAVVELSGGTATVPERTTLTTDELLAMPEHENADAYDVLVEAVWPFVLPYDHALRQVEVGLSHLGIDREELLDLFPSTAPTTAEVDALVLGGSVAWGTLVTTEAPATPRTWWGIESDTGPHPVVTADTVSWYVALRYVPELLARLDLPDPSEDLLDLLHARYVQGGPNVVPMVTGVAGSCDFADYYLGEVYVPAMTPGETPSAVTFTRMATFVRLQRTLGWSWFELDQALTALGVVGSTTETNVDATILGRLADLVRVRKLRPTIPLDELFAWFAAALPTRLDRDTKEEPQVPLYDRLFLDPSTVDPATSPFELNVDRTELQSPGGALLPTLEATLVGALHTTEDDLRTAIAATAVILAHGVEKRLEDLTWVHAITSAARHSGMSVRTMQRLALGVGSAPYANAAAAVTWFEHLSVWSQAGLSPDVLTWVLSMQPDAVDAHAPAEEEVRTFLGALRDRLRALADEAAAGTTLVDSETVRTDAATLVTDPATVSAVVEAIRTATILADLDVVSEALGDWLPALTPLLSLTEPERWPWVHGHLADAVVAERQGVAVSTAVAEGWALSPVVATAVCGIVVSALSLSFENVLLADAFLDVGVDEDPAAPWDDLSATADADAFAAVHWVARVAAVITAFGPDDAFVSRWVTNADRLQLLDLGSLPVTDSISGLTSRYAGVYAVFRLWSASGSMAAWSTALDALAAGQVSSFADQIVSSTGWSRETVDASLVGRGLGTVVLTPTANLAGATTVMAVSVGSTEVTASPSPTWASSSAALLALKDEIAGTGALGSVVVAECLDASGYVTTGTPAATALRIRLHASQTALLDLTSEVLVATPVLYSSEALWRAMRRLSMCARHGVSDAVLTSWAVTGPTIAAGQASDVRQAVRARYDDPKRWSAVWRPVRDQVRKSQQTALLAWLRTNDPDAATNDELYSKYLVDGEMDPINLTTRIQQAVASTQLFVQRVSLGLEAGCSLDDENASRWEWMRSWRVWEAARKVWLYPENWIEPELRVEKSELFEAFERDLLSGDLTRDAAERALVRYVRQLQIVANPTIAGITVEPGDSEEGSASTDTVHVFAQTRRSPLRTFHRAFVEKSRWTPWTEITVGVTGKSLCPVVHSGRLFLFWHELVEMETEDNGGNAERYARIKVCWSEYLDGEWSERRETNEVSTQRDTYDTTLERRWSLRAVPNRRLRVDLVQVLQKPSDADEQEYVEASWELEPSSGELKKGDPPNPERASLRAFKSTILHSGYRIPGDPDEADSELDDDDDDGAPEKLYMPLGGEVFARCLNPYRSRLVAVPPRNGMRFETDEPFVVQDEERAYLIDVTARDTSSTTNLPSGAPGTTEERLGTATFVPFTLHHPYASLMVERIGKAGVDGLLNPSPGSALRFQQVTDLDSEGKSTFVLKYKTSNIVAPDGGVMPLDEVDFGFTSAQGIYNWEVFFHAVTLVAQRLRQNGRYEDALAFMHYVYDPRKKVDNRWRVKPLRDIGTAAVDRWAAGLADEGTAEIDAVAYEAWLDNPFDPHVVAMGRPSAYQRFVIKRYVEIVLDWADARFSADTREAINEAVQLYVYARDVLGPEAPKPPTTTLAVERSFSSMRGQLDTFSNRTVKLENAVPSVAFMRVPKPKGKDEAFTFDTVSFEYFCTPPSEGAELLRARIDDRLFKIRHSMNIDGVVRTLPIFEPAIDPAALVSAAAAGASLGSVLNASSGVPQYRFATLVGRAKELAGVASALGNALLSQLEKKDGERLSSLRERQDLTMQRLTKDVRELQVEDAELSLEAAKAARASVEVRRDYYQGLLDDLPLPEEEHADHAFAQATAKNARAASIDSGTAWLRALTPNFTVKLGSPETQFGGQNLFDSLSAISRGISADAAGFSAVQAKVERESSRKLRKADWQQQVAMADSEIDQHDELVASAETRVKVAKKELHNHKRQIEQVEERVEFLSRKFTNKELYGWMIGTTAQIHSQTYQLALEVARQAEAAYRHEIGVTTASFVSWTNWDSLRKGALAGERLAFDLARMERAYFDNDRRELQVTKHVSLASLDPVALQQLKDNRLCIFRVPEVLFDLDFPGHYFRRLKGVTVSVPCVSGPYTGVNATLSLQQTHVRVSTDDAGDYAYDPSDPDLRIRVDPSVESIAVSGAQDESGVFNFDFNGGARYVPFERRGVVGYWRLELTSPYPSFDPQSIADVVLTLRYTARDGGVPFRAAVIADLPALVENYDGAGTGFRRGLSARHDFPDAWHSLLNPPDATDPLSLSFELRPEHFPVGMRTPGLEAVSVEVALVRKTGSSFTPVAMDVALNFGAASASTVELDVVASADPPALYGALHGVLTIAGGKSLAAPVDVELTIALTDAAASGFGTGTPTRLDPTRIEDIVLVVHYVIA